jgi:rhodanese-related sulfurtransferase
MTNCKKVRHFHTPINPIDTTEALAQAFQFGGFEMDSVILDVRELDEFKAEHIEGSIHAPLSGLAFSAPGILRHLKGREIVIMCMTGNRAKMAEVQLGQIALSEDPLVKVYEGGLLKWKSQGKPVVGEVSSSLPIMRQVQLTVGILILLSTVLGLTVNHWFFAATLFFGGGLTFAGVTGFCGLALILSKMPWNFRTELS